MSLGKDARMSPGNELEEEGGKPAGINSLNGQTHCGVDS